MVNDRSCSSRFILSFSSYLIRFLLGASPSFSSFLSHPVTVNRNQHTKQNPNRGSPKKIIYIWEWQSMVPATLTTQLCYSSAGKGTLAIRNQGKPCHTTNLIQETYRKGKPQEGGCLCSGEKQQGTEQKAGFV